MPTRLIASSLALIAFAVAVLAGIGVDNPATTILWRAILAMVICYCIGLFIGSASQRAIEEAIEEHKKNNPLAPKPDLNSPADVPQSQGNPTSGNGVAA